MTGFHEYLRDRLAVSGFSTEDTLAAFLPLVREVLEVHAAGMVAPLEGLDALLVDGARIWFEEARRQPLRTSTAALRAVELAAQSSVEIVAEVRRTIEVGEGDGQLEDLAIGRRDAPVTRPVYLPGYLAWEHMVGHHDPLVDIFSLGLILASLACGLDLTEPEDLARFVAGRRNLFGLNPALHPALAQAIYRMTELDRHRRVQDLHALRNNLENYRDQEIDFEVDLARVPGFAEQDRPSKQQAVLGKLRERLFEISRRNRLLHFRPTMQTVNLTHASVPLVFDIKNIRSDQILTWNDVLHKAVTNGTPISLNKYLNFAEALYLPAVLDHIIAEAKRDQAEFGFAQLRLVICFLHWTNLKEKPPEHFDSPLVLLPVELRKKKGIRDTYSLEPLSVEAEINPVVRHLFQQLYGIELPEGIDLGSTTIDEFFEHLRAKIETSEPAVTLNKLDRPRIALIHEKARRRLDQYCRRARLAGAGVRSFMDLDYSYDPANYHPLGIRLFSAKIRPPATRLRTIIEERPRPRVFAAAEPEPPVAEKERSFFSLQEGAEENPYAWNFDLCSVTLGNFKYRKMSLVRDYEALLDEQPPNPAFDATFSLVPRDPMRPMPTASTLDDRYDVVPCDPTQASAIEEAHTGHSYIIQGPPGTGKSQTITNLIADYVARGNRVLFVCEKRAAIDVVFARLRQRGLGDLCCLIHDSQTDKKEFVLDLKRTYEALVVDDAPRKSRPGRNRQNLLKELQDDLRPLELFDAAMQRSPDRLGMPVRQLLRRAIELAGEAHAGLRDHENATEPLIADRRQGTVRAASPRGKSPEISELQKERLPDYATWREHRERVRAFADALAEVQPDGILANHPLHLLAPHLAQAERPLEMITQAIHAAEEHWDHVQRTLGACGIPRDPWQTLDRAKLLAEHAGRLLPVARAGQLSLLDLRSQAARQFAAVAAEFRRRRQVLDEAREATRSWRQKLPATEVPLALEQARTLEKTPLAWLRPGWWRLRAVLRRSYDFSAHVFRPAWTQILAALEREYAAARELEQQRRQLAEAYRIPDDVPAWIDLVAELQGATPGLPGWLAEIQAALLKLDRAPQMIEKAAEAESPLRSLVEELGTILCGHQEYALDALRDELHRILAALADLPAFLQCLAEVAAMPDALGTALRTLRLPLGRIEATCAARDLAQAFRADRSLQRFTGAARDRHAGRLEQLYDRWLQSNAAEIRQRVQQRLLENVRTAGLPATQLTDEQKQLKQQYNRGRRELEHEFGKTMRFKSIRDLVSGDSGTVIRDLKPVWLMSPLSVSDTLPLDTGYFDVVIFDEASQITLEEAVPPLFRAEQTIVVGDEMQLPPTDFFSAKRAADDEEGVVVEEDGEAVAYDLQGNSFLSHAARNLASTMLGWHYRSRSESLVSFSNWAFYEGRLLTVPEQCPPAGAWSPLEMHSADDGPRGAEALLQRPISFHHMRHGVYDKRRNRAEADYIAHLVRALLTRRTGLSVGIVAFSEAQQDEIEGALDRLAQQDDEFRDLLEAEQDREVDGQFVGLLVKNLENIQGDERDIVILSVCYGPGPQGRMLMNFGPINKSGGEKRLNVAFSRAKHHMAVVSSIRADAITNDYNDGANCLKNYLRYAEAVSSGQSETAQRILRGMSPWQDAAEADDEDAEDPVARQMARALAEHGYVVDRAVGHSHFRCDLAVRRPDEPAYRLAILLDNDAYYEQSDLLEREMMRPRLLRTFGWNVVLVLAKDWYEDRAAVLDRLLGLLQEHS